MNWLSGVKALGAVVELADPRLGQDRETVDRALHEHLEVLPVLVEERELEGVRDAVGRHPRLGLGLEATDEQAAHLLLDVGPAVGVAQHREVPVHALDRLGDDVEVLGRVERDVDPGHRADGSRPLPGAVDDDVGLDVTVVGAHPGGPPVTRQHVGDADTLGDPHPEPAARPWRGPA